MNTCVSNLLATVPEAPHSYSAQKGLSSAVPPRFDLIVKNLTMDNNEKKYRQKSTSHLDKTNLFNSRLITEKPQERDLSNVNIRSQGNVPMVDTSAVLQGFLSGDKDAVLYCDKKELVPSTYQNRFKGLQIYSDHARIVDDNRVTLAGTTAPDPAVLRATGLRYQKFSRDLKNSSGM